MTIRVRGRGLEDSLSPRPGLLFLPKIPPTSSRAEIPYRRSGVSQSRRGRFPPTVDPARKLAKTLSDSFDRIENDDEDRESDRSGHDTIFIPVVENSIDESLFGSER